MSLAFEPAYEGKGAKPPLTPEAPDFSSPYPQIHKNDYDNIVYEFFYRAKPNLRTAR
jgi:hypothetical protein